MNIGYCKDCYFRDSFGDCTNDAKLHENVDQQEDPIDDHLIYSYNEDGSFRVGEFFGCIHFTKNHAQNVEPL